MNISEEGYCEGGSRFPRNIGNTLILINVHASFEFKTWMQYSTPSPFMAVTFLETPHEW
jgi:hypothetical protein